MSEAPKATSRRGEGSTALVPYMRPAFILSRVPARAAKATVFCASVVLRIVVILLVVGGAGFGALYAKLSHSPISMSFLVPPIENAVNRTLSGMRFDIGDAVLRRSDKGLGIEFRLAKVRLVDEDNSPIAESPFAAAEVSMKALLRGRLAPRQIDLIGPKLFLQYTDERGIALSFTDPRDTKADLRNGNADAPTAPAGEVRTTEPGQAAQGADQPPSEGMIHRARGRAVGVTHAFNKILSKTRSGESAFLTSFGIRDATVYFDKGQQITEWSVPEAEIDLTHSRKNSLVTGNVSVKSPAEAFDFQFRIEQNRRKDRLVVGVLIEDIVPHAFSAEFPSLNLPKMWNMPVTMAADFELGGNGDILGASIQTTLKGGEFYAPWDSRHPALIDSGKLHLTYSREEGSIKLVDSEIRWGESRLKMRGTIQRQRESGRWDYQIQADEIALGAEQFGIPVIPLDRMLAQGNFDPKRGVIVLDRFFLQAAEAQINLTGTFTQGRTSPAIKLSGRVSPMPVAFFKLIWPKFVAYGARDWIGHRIPTGRVAGGTLNVDIPADALASLPADGHLPQEAVDMKLDLEDLEIYYIRNLPPLRVDKAVATLVGQRFFFNVPKSAISLPSGKSVEFSDGEFIIGDLRPRIPNGEVHFKSEAGADAVLELLDQPALHYVSALNVPMPQIDGDVQSTFSLAFPLIGDLKFKDMKLNGRSRVSDARATNLPGGFGVHSGNIDFDVSEKAIEARGEVKVNGLPVLVGWQRIFDAPADRQPPLRLRTVLDEKARDEFGLKVNHLVRGGVATELTVKAGGSGRPEAHFEANLSDADILMSSLGWRKPPGQRAVLTFDLVPLENGKIDLRDVSLQGDDLTVRGTMRLDENRQPISFNFPTVALNQQTQLDMSGDFGSGKIWKVRVKGTSYDGRQFFRSLFSAGQVSENQPQLPEDTPGLDVDAKIDTVIGYFDTTLKDLAFTAQRRDNRLSYLDLHGQLNGKSPFAARVQSKKNEPRQLLADATDAGNAFRLVGFYPTARGGEVSLRVNLDGSGPVQKSGTLFAHDFRISNDQVVEEVLAGQAARKVAQEQPPQNFNQLQFDRMRAQFSVGSGQFILHEAAINGPALGATLRGSIDFKREQMNLSGTYVPFYGINSAIELIPILGGLLAGRSGEGLFGITFAVQGPTRNPDVKVNPVSVLAPGFLRQLFEFNQPETNIARPDQRNNTATGARASSLPPATR